MTFYVPRHFRVDDAAALERFVEANGFCTLVSAGTEGLWASHVPLRAARGEDGGLRLEGHMARANGHWFFQLRLHQNPRHLISFEHIIRL